MRRRWPILLILLPVYTVVVMLVATGILVALAVEDWGDVDLADVVPAIGDLLTAEDWWASLGPGALIFVASQIVFLVPVMARRPPRERRGRSLTASLLLAAAIAGFLTAAFGAAVMDLIAYVTLPASDFDQKGRLWLIPLVVLALGWAGWSFVLLVFARGIWADRTLGRVVGFLLAGTLLETLVVIPLDVMVRRRTDCYCGTGTFVALSLSGLATLWLAGPGVVIALLAPRHRLWRELHCVECGYPRGPSPGARCPECGSAWQAGETTPMRTTPAATGDANERVDPFAG
jgi:hypothetical protein